MNLPVTLRRHAQRGLVLPLKYTPFGVQKVVLQQALSHLLAPLIDEGDLDFLRGRWLAIEVEDLGLRHCFTLDMRGRLRVSQRPLSAATISGNWRDFLALAAQRIDPDTLFFQRRLRISGDTDLGHAAKNALDNLEWEGAAKHLHRVVVRLDGMVNASS